MQENKESKIQELINKLCPDGVEFKKIEEFTSFEQPSKYIVKNTKYNDNSQIPVLTAGKTFILGYTDEEKGIYYASKDNPVIIFDDFTGAFKWVDFPFKVKSSAMKIITTNENESLIRFLYYMMGFLNITSKAHKRLWISMYSQIKVPLPPIEVQREIVQILDNFTFSSSELRTWLNEELKARKKQYEYYKESILKKYINETTKYETLGNLFDVRDGTHDSPKKASEGKYLITSKNIKNGKINFEDAYYISEKDYNFINIRSKVEKGDVLFTMIGTVGEIGVVSDNTDFAIKNLGLIKTGEYLESEFLKHYLTSDFVKEYIKKNISKGTQSFLALGKLRSIPVPMIKKDYKRIVDILDRLYMLTNDLIIGLPAEIEARQKQYEYYRDKLLNFKEMKKN